MESDLSGEWKYGWLSIAEPIQPKVGTPSRCDPVKSDNLIASRGEMSGDGRVEERASVIVVYTIMKENTRKRFV